MMELFGRSTSTQLGASIEHEMNSSFSVRRDQKEALANMFETEHQTVLHRDLNFSTSSGWNANSGGSGSAFSAVPSSAMSRGTNAAEYAWSRDRLAQSSFRTELENEQHRSYPSSLGDTARTLSSSSPFSLGQTNLDSLGPQPSFYAPRQGLPEHFQNSSQGLRDVMSQQQHMGRMNDVSGLQHDISVTGGHPLWARGFNVSNNNAESGGRNDTNVNW